MSEKLVSIDRYLYERILFNLISNALKFTPSGGEILVSLGIEAGQLRLTVQDTGIGISASDIDRIFQRFKQADSSSTRRFEGAGLGLALVKEFSQLLGGDVSVQSTPGKASVFTVDCLAPSVEISAAASGVSKSPVSFVELYGHSFQPAEGTKGEEGRKVLIVEDNQELAYYMTDLLKNFCRTKIARDGEEALRVVHEWAPDLVLSDIMMPNRDGISLCRELKGSPETSRIPVILLTALTYREALIRGWEAGADDYLFKPFHPKELLTRVRAVLVSVEAAAERARAEEQTRALRELEKNQTATLNIMKDLERENQERKQAEEKLAGLLKELENSNKELDSFAYSVSHDLKAPLRGISQVADWIYQDFKDRASDEQKDNLELMRRRVTRMNNLIEGILQYSRLGRTEVITELVDCHNIVREILDSINVPPHITITIEGHLPKVNVVRVYMEQIFQNLLSNAVRCMDKDKGEIKIGYIGRDAQWEFYVRDNGPGLAREHFERIFKIFQTLVPRDKTEATGIGLSIAKKVVELAGGRIWLESEVGKGSTFYFTLPKK